jgi:hypothetical protein
MQGDLVCPEIHLLMLVFSNQSHKILVLSIMSKDQVYTVRIASQFCEIALLREIS